jgi:hypothetical protein
LLIVVAMWGVSCQVQEGIGKKQTKNRVRKKTQKTENQKRKTGIPVGEADAD